MHPRPTRQPPSSAAAGGNEMTIAMAVSSAAGCSARITVSASLMLSVKPARHRISPSARYHTGSLSLNRRVPRALRDVVRSRLTISMRPLEPSRQIKYPRSTGEFIGESPASCIRAAMGVSFLPCGSCTLVSAGRDQMASAERSPALRTVSRCGSDSAAWTRPRSVAIIASSSRLETPSFSNIRVRWCLIVCALMPH